MTDDPLTLAEIKQRPEVSREEQEALAALVQSDLWQKIIVGRLWQYYRRALMTGLTTAESVKYLQGQYAGLILAEECIKQAAFPVKHPEPEATVSEADLMPRTSRSY